MGKPLVGEVVVLPFPQTNLQSCEAVKAKIRQIFA